MNTLIKTQTFFPFSLIKFFSQVAKHFYRFKNEEQKSVGTDVLALDILRGRDHGMNNYVKYLELCTNKPIGNWTDLKQFISDEV